MTKHQLGLCSAALLGILTAACSSDGRVAFGGGSSFAGGVKPGGGSSSSGDGSGGVSGGGGGGNSSDGGASPASASNDEGTASRIVAGADDALTSAGNVGDLLTESGGGALDDSGLVETADNTIDPLARVSVDDDTIVGSGAANSSQALGVSALSESQTQGDVATLGVLTNGQVLTADANVAEGGSTNGLIGAGAHGDQVIGEPNDAIAVSALSPTAEGEVASANVLNNGDLLNVDIEQPDSGGAQGLIEGAVEAVAGAGGGLLAN